MVLWAILAAVEVGLGGSVPCPLTPRPGVSCLGKGSLGQALLILLKFINFERGLAAEIKAELKALSFPAQDSGMYSSYLGSLCPGDAAYGPGW